MDTMIVTTDKDEIHLIRNDEEDISILKDLEDTARLQRTTGKVLQDLVSTARSQGKSWIGIADALGMNYITVMRQHKNGGPIVVTVKEDITHV